MNKTRMEMMTAPMHIPERFFKAITIHVLKNMLDIDEYNAPLILGIHGRPGEGKTYMCEQALQKIGVKSYLISGGQLESDEAGRPAALIRETYLKAGADMVKGKTLASAILINDFDTGVGNWGKIVQFTINTQQLFAELMHLTDYPESVEGKQTTRVPIIITGNNFESLHLPLLRTGRMWLFEWEPRPEEKFEIVAKVFPFLKNEEIKNLVMRYERQPISFYSHAKNSMIDSQIWAYAIRNDPSNVIRNIRTSPEYLDLGISTSKQSLATVVDACEKILTDSKLANHLPKREE